MDDIESGVSLNLLAGTLGKKLAGEDLLVLPPGGQVWKAGANNQ